MQDTKHTFIADFSYLQIRAYSKHPEVAAAAQMLVEAHYVGSVRARRKEKEYLRDARKLVASLWLHNSDMFRFTTKTAHFSPEGRKQVWMTARTLTLFNLMLELRWIVKAYDAIPPYASKKKKGGQSAIYARRIEFYNLLQNLQLQDIEHNPDLPRLELKTYVKDQNGKDEAVVTAPSYESLDEFHKLAVDTLNRQWELLKKSRIQSSNGAPIPLSDLFYCIKSLSNFMEGGRLYAPFCIYSKQDRLGIRIDGRPVGSLDFSHFHPSLLLAERGMKKEPNLDVNDHNQDVYSMPDHQVMPRAVHKKLIGILINAASEKSAVIAFQNTYSWVEANGELKVKTYKGNEKRQGKQVFADNRLPARAAYIESFKRHHPVLATFICSGRGKLLQAGDAAIALMVISKATAKGIVVLTVHDEFIVQAEHNAFIEECAVYAYKFACEHWIGYKDASPKLKWDVAL
jgi:hypothetical protein